MSREEVEKKILEKCREIRSLCNEYEMASDYLSISIIDGHIGFNNKSFEGGMDYEAGTIIDLWRER